MAEDAEVDFDDEVEAGETKEPSVKAKEDGKKERKMYKGEVRAAQEVSEILAKGGVVPVQPVKRKYKHQNFEQSLPPSFVVTRFNPSYNGLRMHYYQPSSGQKSYREVPKDLELNVLSGTRATELRAEWDKALATRLGHLCRRLTCTIGADPEVFVVDKKDVVIPAWEFLPSKKEPKPITVTVPGGYSYHGTAYWDGFQAEFTTHAGLSCLAQMGDTVRAGLDAVLQAAQKYDKKAKLSLQSVVQVSDKTLQEAKEEHVQFGCAPSLNVYGLKGNTQDGRTVGYRFAGGHIHIGHKPGAAKTERMIRAMDAVLGVACVSLFAQYDNPVRRQFYGQPGEYRLPAHGFEYRTLSNAWLSHPTIYHMVFDLARAAAGLVEENLDTVWVADEKETVETIMNHDVPQARAILKRNETIFKGILQTIGGTYLSYSDAPDVAYKVWANGMETAVTNPSDIAGNWCLGATWAGHSEGAQFAQAYHTLVKGKTL